MIKEPYREQESKRHPKDTRWDFTSWTDGLQQWVFLTSDKVAERVVGTNSRRKRWVIVDRGATGISDEKYPPKIAGPYPNLKIAMLAAELMS